MGIIGYLGKRINLLYALSVNLPIGIRRKEMVRNMGIVKKLDNQVVSIIPLESGNKYIFVDKTINAILKRVD